MATLEGSTDESLLAPLSEMEKMNVILHGDVPALLGYPKECKIFTSKCYFGINLSDIMIHPSDVSFVSDLISIRKREQFLGSG